MKTNIVGMFLGWSIARCVCLCRSEIQDGRHPRNNFNI